MTRIGIRTLFLSLALLSLFSTLPKRALASGIERECSICGMKTSTDAKTGFDSVRDGKPVYFCSFACAHRFHEAAAHKNAPLSAHDYQTGAAIDSGSAYFLVKSKNITKEVDFDMPPTVVAFATESGAKEVQSRLKDGEVVKGLDAVTKAYK